MQTFHDRDGRIGRREFPALLSDYAKMVKQASGDVDTMTGPVIVPTQLSMEAEKCGRKEVEVARIMDIIYGDFFCGCLTIRERPSISHQSRKSLVANGGAPTFCFEIKYRMGDSLTLDSGEDGRSRSQSSTNRQSENCVIRTAA